MTMIYIPSGKYLEGEHPEMDVGIEGWFTLRALNRYGRVVRERTFKERRREVGPFHNLLLNNGLNRFATQLPESAYRYCHVGLGTATPAVTDSQLSNFLANVSLSLPVEAVSNSGSPNYYSARTFQWTSAIGALGTNNLTEVGISGTSTNGNLFSRELIRDGGGSPTSFPIASTEQLQVTYELRIYPKLTDTLATVNISGVNYDTTTRGLAISSTSDWGPQTCAPAGGTNYNVASKVGGSIAAFSGAMVANTTGSTGISGSLGGATSILEGSYSGDTHHKSTQATWSTTAGNGNIATIRWPFYCACFQIGYSPAIPKTSAKTLLLNQRISWARR